MKKLEYAIYALILILITAGAIMAKMNEDFFRKYYVVEDGPLEWGTVVMFVICAIMMISRAIRLKKYRSRLFVFMTCLFAMVFIFGAGEEISWGQRIFNVETPEWLEEKNKQGETNFHNLEIGGVSINKLVFSKMLAVGLVFYLIVLPIWATRSLTMKNRVDRFAIPLPTKLHTMAWIVAMALPEIVIDSGKKGEVREICAGLMMFVHLSSPRNKRIYDASHAIK